MTYPYDTTTNNAIDALEAANSDPYDVGTNPDGYGVGGHRQNFTDDLNNVAIVANSIADAAAAAEDYAGRMSGTSTTSRTIGTGSHTFTTQANKFFEVGRWVDIVYDATNSMIGYVTSYSSTTLQVTVTSVEGSGTYASWNIYTSNKPGETGAQGTQGIQGDTGETGRAAGLAYSFSTNTSATDPTSGKIKFNSATIASVTEIYISETDNEANSIATLIATFDDSTSTIKGRIDVVDPATPNKGGSFAVTGLSDNGTWVTLSVTYLSGSSVPSNAADVAVNYTPKGDKGDTGSQGLQGVVGATGRMAGIPMVYDGSSYASGDPGTAKLRRNNATPALVDRLYISETDSDAKGVASWWSSASSGTSTNRGRIDIFHETDPENFLSYNITGALTDNGGWDTLVVSYRDHGGTLSDTDPLLVHAFASGDKGDTGVQGPQGDPGADGSDGAQGDIGPTAATEYDWDTGTADADPGNGKIRVNSGTYGSVTRIYVDDLERNGADVSAWLESMDDSTNTDRRGDILLKSVTNPAYWLRVYVSGLVTDKTGYYEIVVTYVAHNGTLSGRVSFEFSRAGNKGLDGAGSGDVQTTGGVTSGHLVVYADGTGDVIQDGGALTAATIPNVAAGGISSTNVQTAINELDTEKAPLASPSFTGTVDVSQAHLFSGVISPTQITADQDNYAPTGFSTCSVVRLTSDAARAITGLAGGSAGRNVLMINANASSNITLTHDATSTAANRFYCPNSVNFVLLPNACAFIWYDTTSSRWRVNPAGGNASGIYAAAQGSLSAGTLYSQLGELDTDVTGKANNGFVTFTGPASSNKNFALPNANETVACLGQAQAWSAAQTFLNSSGIKIQDTGADHTLGLIVGTNFSANRTLTITPGDADRSITLGGNVSTAGALTISGAFGTTLMVTNTTSVTLPTTGTIASLGVAQTWTQPQSFNSSTLLLNGSSSGTGTLNAPAAASTYTWTLPAVTGTLAALSLAQTWSAAQTFINSSGIKIQDTDASHTLGIVGGSNLTGDRTLTLTTGDASRSFTMSGDISFAANFTTSGANALTLTTTGTTNVTLPTTGTLATTDASSLASGTLSDARLSAAATPYGKQAIPLPADAWLPATTNGAALETITGTNNERRVLSFDTSTQETAYCGIRMPKQWNESTLTFDVDWEHPSTTTNFGVVFELSAVAISNDDPADPAFGTAQTVTDTGGTTNDHYTSPESSAITAAGTPAENDYLMLRLRRVPANGSDTLAVDARIKNVNLYVTTNAGNDA